MIKLESTKDIVKVSVILTLLMEIVSIIGRFVINVEITRDTASTVGVLTGGIRIHHGYIGLLLMLLVPLVKKRSLQVSRFVLVIGIALLCSDLIHHFLVLWPITGSPQFDFFYK